MKSGGTNELAAKGLKKVKVEARIEKKEGGKKLVREGNSRNELQKNKVVERKDK